MFINGRLCLALFSVAAAWPWEEYHEDTAKKFANMASTAYCHNLTQVYQWSCQSCKASGFDVEPGTVKVIDADARNSSRIVLGKLKGRKGCFMAFRGSANYMNWMRNFEYWQVNWKPFPECHGLANHSTEEVKCKVHGGFHKIWENVKDDILKALSELECKNEGQLYITGHSLGAALSTLAMFSLDAKGYSIAKSYTFEAPRVGNTGFAQEFDERFTRKFPVYRITHWMDPVVHVPPQMLGFQHVNREVWYDEEGKYKVCEMCTEDECPNACANQFTNIPGMLMNHRHEHCHNEALLPGHGFCDPPGCKPDDPNRDAHASDVIV